MIVSVAAKEKVELPDQVPNIMQPRIHALPAKWAVNVSGVASNEHASDAKLGGVAMMNAEIAAPMKSVRIESGGRALRQNLLHAERAKGRLLRVRESSLRCGGVWRSSETRLPVRIHWGTIAVRQREGCS